MLLPLVVCFQLLFILGLSWLMATIHVFFRDTIHIMGLVITFWMFLTPIFYPESLVPKEFSFLLRINPMASLLKIYRTICLEGRLPDLNDVLFFAIVSVTVVILGYAVFTRHYHKFADHI